MDQKYIEKIWGKFQKTKFTFAKQPGNYLHSTHIVLSIKSNLEMI